MNSFFTKRINIKKAIRKIAIILLGLLAFILISSAALAIYVNQNKDEIINEINDLVNENINGKLDIDDIKFKFLTGFPNATLSLKNVTLKDSLWNTHKKTFLDAKEIQFRINVLKFLKNKIEIRKIVINDATINLYKDKNGYTNGYLLKSKNSNPATTQTKFKEITLNQVAFNAINLKDKKWFQFDIQSLKSKLNYIDNHIKTDVHLKMLVRNMIFKPKNGSFLKNKSVNGVLSVDFLPKQNLMNISSNKIKFDGNKIDLNAKLNLDKNNTHLFLELKTEIKWLNMTKLLSQNLTKRLKLFDFKNLTKGSCVIDGDLNVKGNPKIIIKAKIIDNEMKTPEGTITNANFEIEYNNHLVKGKGNTDPNSVIIFKDFSGNYEKIPFKIPLAKIFDLQKPYAKGKFISAFEVKHLNQFIDKNLIDFKSGKAQINFDFNIDIVDLKLNKPKFTGKVFVSDAHLEYVPKKLTIHDTDIELVFTNKSLLIKNINFIDRKNTVYMNGKIDDFLYLFYHDNEKIKVNWNIYSPSLDIQQFIGMLTNKSKFIKNNALKKDSFSSKLQKTFDKSQAIINLNIDKVNYENLIVENLKTTITTYNDRLKITNGSLKTLNGSMLFDGELTPKNNSFSFSSNVQIQKFDIEQVVKNMNNFGLKSFNSHNLKGLFSADASISGLLLPKGQVKQNTISLDIKKGTINTLGGTVDFDGQLYPKDHLYSFNFNTQVSHINTVEFLKTFDNFDIKSLKTKYLNGHIAAKANVNGQLHPNWRLYKNDIHLNISNGYVNCIDGNLKFDAVLMPKNESYAFTANTQVNTIDLEQFLYTMSYFNIKTLDERKIKGRFSSYATLNGTLLSNGNLQENTLEIELKNGLVKSMDGTIDFNGKMIPQKNNYGFDAKANIKQVNIQQFLETFNNFGINSFKPKNINGQLNATASIYGLLQPKIGLVPNSISGDATVEIYDGALIDFEPVKNVWRYIFPFRDFKNITFSSIKGDFNIKGDDVNVSNFKVNSNVLNFDMEGVYSYNIGTNLALTVPLRNPKNDEKINDEILKNDKRDDGIILHLLVTDGENGKMKIKWNKNHKKERK